MMNDRDPDGLIGSWTRRSEPASGHARAEVAAARHRGGVLDTGAPVPGCDCARCLTLAAGGTADDVATVDRIIAVLATVDPDDRLHDAQAIVRRAGEQADRWPAPWTLTKLAAKVPGARTRRSSSEHVRAADDDDHRVTDDMVVRARRTPLVTTAKRLGLGEGLKRGAEVAFTCPFHDDSRPSLRVDPKAGNHGAGLWFCHPCGEGGDGIELVQRVRGIGFLDAVRWLVSR